MFNYFGIFTLKNKYIIITLYLDAFQMFSKIIF